MFVGKVDIAFYQHIYSATHLFRRLLREEVKHGARYLLLNFAIPLFKMPTHPRRGETERFPRPHDQNSYHDLAQRSSLPTVHETATQGYPIGIPGRVDQYGTRCERLAASSPPSSTSLQSAFCGSPWMSEQESSAPSPGMTLHGAKGGPTNLGGAPFDRNTFFGQDSTP